MHVELAGDLILKVVDHLALRDIVRTAAVCKRWRDAALEHPTYWRFIALEDAPVDAVDLLVARLSRARSRPICVTLYPPRPYLQSHIVDMQIDLQDIFGAIAHHIGHTQRLMVGLPLSYADSVMDLIRRPADMLEVLQITLLLQTPAPQHEPVPWPSDAFRGRSPPLKELYLSDVLLPLESPLAFQNVVELSISYHSRATVDIPDVFALFPRVQHLVLGGDISLDLPVFRDAEAWRRIAKLEVCNDEEHGRLVSWNLPSDAIRFLTVRMPHELVVRWIYDCLDEPLDLHVSGTQINFSATITGRLSGRVRRVIEFSEERFDGMRWDGIAPPPHCLVSHDALRLRLVTLTISAEVWNGLAGHFPPLEALHDLTLRIGPYEIFDVLTNTIRQDRSLQCPVLRTFSIRNRWPRPIHLQVDTICHFLEHCLSFGDRKVAFPVPPSIRLEGPLSGLQQFVQLEHVPEL